MAAWIGPKFIGCFYVCSLRGDVVHTRIMGGWKGRNMYMQIGSDRHLMLNTKKQISLLINGPFDGGRVNIVNRFLGKSYTIRKNYFQWVGIW